MRSGVRDFSGPPVTKLTSSAVRAYSIRGESITKSGKLFAASSNRRARVAVFRIGYGAAWLASFNPRRLA